jgi:hypothetical protein
VRERGRAGEGATGCAFLSDARRHRPCDLAAGVEDACRPRPTLRTAGLRRPDRPPTGVRPVETTCEFLPWFVDLRPSCSSSVHDHPNGSIVKYLGLAYFTPEEFAAMAPDDVKALVSQCPPPLDEEMRATGKVLVSASIGDLEFWRTLRPRNGKTQVTGGPYTESKEAVEGLFIIEADSEDEALGIASMHPAATLADEGGWAVELIPMGLLPEPQRTPTVARPSATGRARSLRFRPSRSPWLPMDRLDRNSLATVLHPLDSAHSALGHVHVSGTVARIAVGCPQTPRGSPGYQCRGRKSATTGRTRLSL